MKKRIRRLATLRALFWIVCWSLMLVPPVDTCQGAQQSGSPLPKQLEGARSEVFKVDGAVELRIHIFEPKSHKAGDRKPAIVFFFGGGWKNGSPEQFKNQAAYLASRGMVAMSAEYRVLSRHGTKAVICVKDAKSAIRWVRKNAERLGVDPNRVAAGGGSAGGHLAASTGVIAEFDEPNEDPSISSVPNAMVLFNPALVLAQVEGVAPLDPERVGDLKERMGVDPKELSPYHQVRSGQPPAIIFHGKADTTVPYVTAELFDKAMRAAGNRCELVGYEGQKHGFFNWKKEGTDPDNFSDTVRRMDGFLKSLGYLQGEPTVDDFVKGLE